MAKNFSEEQEIIRFLGKRAYETHIGFPNKEEGEGYFKREFCPWDELPASTQAHWERIAKAVSVAASNLDYGDLVD